jgi:hypothetical protein
LFFFNIKSQIIIVQPSRSKSSMARSTRLMNTTRRTIRRQTTYLSVPSIFNGNSKGGQVLAVGENGMTQLGLKSSIDQRKNPQPVLIPEPIVQIAAGPLHSVCLTDQNNIYTFGCNDEHALGRSDNDEGDDIDPFGEVDLSKIMNIEEENIVQIVAGDSHTLILSNIGKVYGRFYRYFVLSHVLFDIVFRLFHAGAHFVQVQMEFMVLFAKEKWLNVQLKFLYQKKLLN